MGKSVGKPVAGSIWVAVFGEIRPIFSVGCRDRRILRAPLLRVKRLRVKHEREFVTVVHAATNHTVRFTNQFIWVDPVRVVVAIVVEIRVHACLVQTSNRRPCTAREEKVGDDVGEAFAVAAVRGLGVGGHHLLVPEIFKPNEGARHIVCELRCHVSGLRSQVWALWGGNSQYTNGSHRTLHIIMTRSIQCIL